MAIKIRTHMWENEKGKDILHGAHYLLLGLAWVVFAFWILEWKIMMYLSYAFMLLTNFMLVRSYQKWKKEQKQQ